MLKFQWNHLAITFIRWRCRSFCEITTATHNHLNICVVAGWWVIKSIGMHGISCSFFFSFLPFIAFSTDARTDNDQQRWRNAQSINKHLDNCIEKLDTLTKYQQHCNWYANHLPRIFIDMFPWPVTTTSSRYVSFHFYFTKHDHKKVCLSVRPHPLLTLSVSIWTTIR